MIKFKSDDSVPGLLVSVRSASEAMEALAGGADVIDVKEPTRGSLGAADPSTMAEVTRAISGRAIVSAALGELTELARQSGLDLTSVPRGIELFKIGLADSRKNANWTSTWRDAIGRVLGKKQGSVSRPVAVVYADWPTANAPEPSEILNAAIQFGCPALLVDTWDKSDGSLFDHWTRAELISFAEEVRSHGIRLVLAGSLMGAAIDEAARLGPDLIAVRTAACEGGRNGTVSRDRVQALKQSISQVVPTSPLSGAKKFP